MKKGLVIGKFMPPHLGNLDVCKIADLLSEELNILIIAGKNDLIPLSLRQKWMKIEFPKAIIQSLIINIDSTSIEFSKNLFTFIKTNFNAHNLCIFGSETYTVELSKQLQSKYTIVDPSRLAQPVRASNILKKPYLNWFKMPLSVRKDIQKRVVLIGPESVGKSTLAKNLTSNYITGPFVPEYGRTYEEFRDVGKYDEKEFEEITKLHSTHRQILAQRAGPILLEDTDELMTSVWAEMLIGKTLIQIENQIVIPDLYLLLDPSVPFKHEPIRYFSDRKKQLDFFHKIKNKVEDYSANFEILSGSWSTRETDATRIIHKLMKKTINWKKIKL